MIFLKINLKIMISKIAYTIILGKPLIMYFGIFTISFLLLTAIIAFLNLRAINVIPFKWHTRLAVVTIILAICHATLALSLYYHF